MGRRRVPAPPLRTSPFTSDPFPAPASDGLVVVELGVALRREQVEDVVLVHGLADEHDVGPRPERDAGADGQWQRGPAEHDVGAVSYTHLRAHETRHDLVCRLLLEKKKNTKK